MRCPYCKTPISENTPACPRCALNVETATQAFGAPLQLHRGVNDTTLAFTEPQRRRIRAVFDDFHHAFPQVHLSLATVALAAETGLAAYAFWIFNRGGLCPSVERGGANHDILLTLDTENYRAHLTFGYGLEPFVGEAVAAAALAAGAASFRTASWTAGVLSVAEALEAQLITVTQGLDRTYGVNVSDFYEAEKQRLEEIAGTANNRDLW